MKNDFCEHIIDLLSGWGAVTYRAMFGGFGLYKDNQIFALVCEDVLYLKADKQSRDIFEAQGSLQFTYEAKNKLAKTSYWTAPEAFFNVPADAAKWAEIAYQAGVRAHKSPRKSA